MDVATMVWSVWNQFHPSKWYLRASGDRAEAEVSVIMKLQPNNILGLGGR